MTKVALLFVIILGAAAVFAAVGGSAVSTVDGAVSARTAALDAALGK